MDLTLVIHRANGNKDLIPLLCRIDTAIEVDYFTNGGIMPYVVRKIIANE